MSTFEGYGAFKNDEKQNSERLAGASLVVSTDCSKASLLYVGYCNCVVVSLLLPILSLSKEVFAL